MLPPPVLQPLSYHRELRDHLKEHAPSLWKQLAADSFQSAHVEAVELELLKSTLLLKRASYERLYSAADRAAAALGLELPLEIFQGPDDSGTNAGLFFAPDVLRVVLTGAVEERLSDAELDALFGHELAHHQFWTTEGGEFFTTLRVLEALSLSSEVAANSLRLFDLATEVYADRAGIVACKELEHGLNVLIKISTGLERTDPEALLEQADKVLSIDTSGSRRDSHPETYIRAKAMALFHAKQSDTDRLVSRMIEGRLELPALDLLARPRVERLTRQVLDFVLQPKWFRTELMLAHARMIFDDFAGVSSAPEAESLRGALGEYGASVLDYFGYLLTDLVAVDPDLEQAGLANVLVRAEALGLRPRVETFVNKELKMTKKVLRGVWADRERLLVGAEEHAD